MEPDPLDRLDAEQKSNIARGVAATSGRFHFAGRHGHLGPLWCRKVVPGLGELAGHRGQFVHALPSRTILAEVAVQIG